MRTLVGVIIGLALTLTGAALSPCAAQVNTGAPDEVSSLDIVEKLGSRVPMDVQFINADGEPVMLGRYFENTDKPTILMLGYYDCPVACPAMVDNINRSINEINFVAGRDFQIVFASFDHTNTVEQAAGMKSRALGGYTVAPVTQEVRDGFVYLTSSEAGARALADAVGFSYRYFPESGEYGHPSGVFVLTNDGRVSRVLYGAGWDPLQMRLALMEASEGKLVSTLQDKFLSFCYRFDPESGSYGLAAFRVVQLSGAATALLVGVLVALLLIGERRKARRRALTDAGKKVQARGATAPAGSAREIPC